MRILSLVALVSIIAVCSARSDLDTLLRQPADQVIELRGEVPDSDNTRACVGTGCVAPPLEGPSTLYWHGDGTCSRLILSCHFDYMVVTLESPGNAVEVYLGWLGQPVPTPLVAPGIPASCSQALTYNVQVSNHTTKSRVARFDLKDQCGTDVVEKSNEDGKQYTNNVHILEFLDPFSSLLVKPNLQIYSHTHIKVQCCHTSKPTTSSCINYGDPDVPTPLIVINCTETSFDLTCSTNEDGYQCRVGLKAGESLGNSQVTYVLDSCTASSGSNSHEIISSGPVGRADLEVVVIPDLGSAGSADDDIYNFSGPHIQFNDDADSNPFVDVQLTISCSVKVSVV